jgi:aminoglycoside 3'-phosphotransferase II
VPGDVAPQPPVQWRQRLDGYAWTRPTAGRSPAAVFRLETGSGPTLFVKTEPAGSFAELPDEIVRLRWIAASALPAPEVLAEAAQDGRHWLLMSAVPGRDLALSLQCSELEPEQIVGIAADGLRRLHSVDRGTCPFDQSLVRRLALARLRVEAGLVDEEDFDDERLGRSAGDLFEELLARRPSHENLVVAHGDATFDNLLAQDGRFSGFIDCARLGLADRHQDLALLVRGIRHDLGEAWVEPFLRRYGHDADPARLAYYQLLDEFF